MSFSFGFANLRFAAPFLVLIISACSKDSDAPQPSSKSDVKINSFGVDNSSKLFLEPFVGKQTGEIYVSLIPQTDGAPSGTITLHPVTTPSLFASNVKYIVLNDDGTNADPASYVLTGSNINFYKRGIYKIKGSVPEDANNKASDTTRELRIQVTSNIPDENMRARLKTLPGLVFKDEILDTTSAVLPAVSTDWMSNNLLNWQDIKSLQGIHYFRNITDLDISGNDLGNVKLDGLDNLKSIYCFNNLGYPAGFPTGLNSIDLRTNSKLTYITLYSIPNLHRVCCQSTSIGKVECN
jgi:hypothetical protein